MSDTMSCPNCSATLPAGASFCTSCGNRIEADASASAPPEAPAPSAPSSGPPEDATRVDNPGLHDSTQVYTPPAPAYEPPAAPAYQPPAAPAYQPPSAPAAPWQPADSGPSTPAAPAWSSPPSAPAASPPPWQQPQQSPPTQGWGEPQQAPPWGAPPATSSSSASALASPLGGLAALVGGLMVIIGLFLDWVGPNEGDAITGWQIATDDKIFFESKDPYLLLVLGLVAIGVGVGLFLGKSRPILRIAAVVIGVAVIGIMVRDWLSIVDVVKDNLPSNVKVSQKIGYFVGIAGGVITAAAAILPAKKA